MSLKVWLPLNGDLRNLGTSNIEVTNNGVTINDAGKIGKCYYFDGNAHYLQLSQSVGNLYSGDFSWAVWLKPTDSTRSIISSEYSSTGSSNVAFELSASRGVRIYWNGSPDIYPSNSTLPINAWTHVAITKTTGIIKTYLNGVLTNTYTGTLSDRPSTSYIRIGDDYRGGTSVSYMGYMNDWRLYDHCLSAAEVHEIAQGLVLHYKLDHGSQEIITSIPSTNVYNYPTFNTASVNGGWNHWGPSGHSGNYGQNTDKKYIYNKNNTYSHWIMEDAGTEKYYLLYQSPAFEGGYRSFQAIIKEENSLPITESICYPTWNARNGGVPNNKWTSIESLGDGFYYCCAEGASQDGSNDLIGIDVLPGYKIYVSECYLENDTETCSPIFSYSSNVIQDSSGYNNNGTIRGNVFSITSKPRFSFSSYFNKGSIFSEVGFPSGENPNFTVAFWVKIFSDISYNIYVDLVGMYDNIGGSGVPFRLELCGSPPGNNIMWFRGPSGQAAGGFNMNSSSSNEWFSKDEWHHIALVGHGDTKQYECYLDGNKCGAYNGSANSWEPNGKFYLGDYSSQIIADFSDFRIYCTPLLDTDIKLLYNTSSRIDNLGGVHSFELNENQSNIFRSELIMPAAKAGYTTRIGEIVEHNGYYAMNIAPAPFYKNISDSVSGILQGYFYANTSYIFDLWIDVDSVIYEGENKPGGLRIIFTDDSSDSSFVFTGGNKGWQHKKIITPSNKTIDRLEVYYWTTTDVFYRLDSYICPISSTKIIKQGILDTTNITENSEIASIYKGGSIYSSKFIEM